ncbi:hypothetical protein [Streptomyces sp. NPDC014623]|uniref:hypothetical protein n=1 Tax=Streptomyces sp. NPDC014623 TaxID=3364875 RepID=UPI0036FF6EF8
MAIFRFGNGNQVDSSTASADTFQQAADGSLTINGGVFGGTNHGIAGGVHRSGDDPVAKAERLKEAEELAAARATAVWRRWTASSSHRAAHALRGPDAPPPPTTDNQAAHSGRPVFTQEDT